MSDVAISSDPRLGKLEQFIGDDAKMRALPDMLDGAAHIVANASGETHELRWVCPCGCRQINTIPMKIGEETPHRWRWDGNREKPSVTPSIRRLDGCKWHGFLTAGVFSGACEA